MQRPRIAVIGASGYSGMELVRLLLGHDGVQLVAAGSDKWSGRPVEGSRDSVGGAIAYAPHAEAAAATAEVFMLATPAEVSHELVPQLLARGARVIDLSGAYRLKNATTHHAAYGFEHQHASLLAEAVYGLPELDRTRQPNARLIANPGCYATAIQLALAPLAGSSHAGGSSPSGAGSSHGGPSIEGSSSAGGGRETTQARSVSLARGLFDSHRFVVDAMSGVTGAGRKASEDFSFAEIADDVRAYRVLRHQHTPEIEQGLAAASAANAASAAHHDVRVTFVPHLLPIKRGILATCHAQLADGATADDVARAFAAAYEGERFIELAKSADDVAIKDVVGTNKCRIGWSVGAHGEVVIVSAIDNLVKGAAGQAVQNLNLMLGLPEQAGVARLRSFHP